MRMLLAVTTLLVFTSSFSQSSKKGDVIFTGVNVITMLNDEVLSDQDVLVSGGKIISVAPRGNSKPPAGALTVNAHGKYLMPGLAEMHGHVPPVDNLEPMKDVMSLFASYGITTVRGMLGHPKHLVLREMLNNGDFSGPRFYTSGPSFNGGSVKSPQEGAAKVREQKAAGYDFLKIHPGLTQENFNAVASTANEVNIPFAGHVSFHVGVWKAIEAGQETIDHLDAFIEGLVPGIENINEEEVGLFGMYIADKADTTRIPELMKALRENNVWVVPTQALAERWMTPARTTQSFRDEPEMRFMDEKTLSNWVQAKNNMYSNPRYDSAAIARYIQLRRKLIFECNRSGVGLLLGCDAPQIFNVPGISTHHELQYLVDAGLTPYEALKTGTVNVGKFYGQTDKMGIIENGANADLVLLNANPFEDIANTKKIEGVMVRGKWMPRATLDNTLKRLEKSGRQPTAFLPK